MYINSTLLHNRTNFICADFIPEKICDDLIEFFEESPNKKPGEVGRGISEEIKKSTDLHVSPKEIDYRAKNYLNALTNVCNSYIKEFPWSSDGHELWGIYESYNIQKYNPTEGFYKWHSERTCNRGTNSLRHLVFMTYLNTVTDAGETEWYHQKLVLKPQKGLTVIWPCDWTHTHRGIPSPTQTKYITTGWYTYFIPGFDYDEWNRSE